jgi:hypothetical protein
MHCLLCGRAQTQYQGFSQRTSCRIDESLLTRIEFSVNLAGRGACQGFTILLKDAYDKTYLIDPANNPSDFGSGLGHLIRRVPEGPQSPLSPINARDGVELAMIFNVDRCIWTDWQVRPCKGTRHA